MPRLIDADAIPWDVDGVGFIPVIGKDEIDEMPTIDAEPVKRGHWIAVISDEEEYKCSECGDIEYYTCNYCPNCGAKMDDACGRWLKQGDEYRCSECGDTTIVAYKNCPNCGAKMDEVNTDEE